jgi:hypothetical protein
MTGENFVADAMQTRLPLGTDTGGDPRTAYRVYVLRCWAEPLPDMEGSSGVLWARRYSVEDVDTHNRYGFASLVELLAFLARASDGSKAGLTQR